MTDRRTEALQRAAEYQWYHRIHLVDDVYTTSRFPEGHGIPMIWEIILEGMGTIDFTGRRVLDVGCRDGLFSFEAERRGAREVIGIDNDLSKGAVEFVIPFTGSQVRMHEANVYDLVPERWGRFDVIIFAGVLYHLRMPFFGLRRLVDLLEPGGLLLIETAVVDDPRYNDLELLYCPVEHSPYEPTSCTFYNRLALQTTLRSMRCRLRWAGAPIGVDSHPYPDDLMKLGPAIGRQTFVFERDPDVGPDWDVLDPYWYGTHRAHSDYAPPPRPVRSRE